VDVKSLPQLDGAMLRRLLFKLHRHRGWLCNYLYYKLDYAALSPSQQQVVEECALKMFGRSLQERAAK